MESGSLGTLLMLAGGLLGLGIYKLATFWSGFPNPSQPGFAMTHFFGLVMLVLVANAVLGAVLARTIFPSGNCLFGFNVGLIAVCGAWFALDLCAIVTVDRNKDNEE